MKIEAIYQHGRLEFTRPVAFKHEPVRVVVDIAECDLSSDSPSPSAQNARQTSQPGISATARAMLERLASIRDAPFPPGDSGEELTEKQQSRIEAFEARAEWRQEQGRVV